MRTVRKTVRTDPILSAVYVLLKISEGTVGGQVSSVLKKSRVTSVDVASTNSTGAFVICSRPKGPAAG